MSHEPLNYEAERLAMIREQLRTRQIADERVLAAMARGPRPQFF
jgi:protein-L-isoaspartate O-methyltransferase